MAFLGACGAASEEPTPQVQVPREELENVAVVETATENKAETPTVITDAFSVPNDPLSDPSGNLSHFYDKLRRVQANEQGALARVTHMGDSSIGRDSLPHMLRTRFQDRFGDGGAGFILMQPHSANYLNRSARISTPLDWNFCFIANRCLSDGHYGLGGVAAMTPGGISVFETQRRGQYGRSVSRFELWFAHQPRGGQIELRIDRGDPILVNTSGVSLTDGWHEERVTPGAHRLRVRAIGGRIRAYGVVMETDGPGVVWDTLSMVGTYTPRMLLQDEDHFANQISHRQSDLVVLAYGGNDLRRFVQGSLTAADFELETRQLAERVNSANPNGSCLVTGIMEHTQTGTSRVTSDQVAQMVQAQKSGAHAAGCAFYDVFQAMGGPGSYRNWLLQGLASTDGKHLNGAGREMIAGRMFDALVARIRSTD